MQCAIDVIDSCGRKGSDLGRPVRDIDIVQRWCPWLSCRVGGAAGIPRSILQDMFHGTVIDEKQFGAFRNQNHVLGKLVRRHVNSWLAMGTRRSGTGLRDGADKEGDQTY